MKIFLKYSAVLFILLFVFTFPEISFSQLLLVEEIEVKYKDTKSFDEDVLISAVGIEESDVYNPQVLGENIYKLQKFYFDNGFFDAKIDTSVRYDFKEEEVFIDIIVKENRHYKIDSLIYVGLDSITGNTADLMNKIKNIKSKDFYDKSLIMQQTNEIIDLLQNNGYMNARLKQDSGTIVKRYSDYSEPALSVILHFEGTDSIFYFGKTNINIPDNKYGVDKGVLKREIAYNEGDIYSKEKKLLSESNISKVPIVQSTRISPYAVNNNRVDFNADIILNKKTEIGPYGAAVVIDNYFYLGGGVQYLNKYFAGGGKMLTLSFDALINSFDVNRIEFSAAVTQPHVFNSRSFLTDKVTVGLYNINDSKNYYLGNLTSYLQSFTDFTFYNNASIDLTEELIRYNYDTATSPTITTFNSFLSTTFVHDNTNDVFSPSKGFFHSLTVGNGGLLPKAVISLFEPNVYYSQYVKLFTSNNFYFNFSKKQGNTVLASKFLVGDIIEYGSGNRVIPLPSFYKFFSGGSSSVRGWGARDNGVLVNTNDGGDFLVEGSFELRQKLFPGADNFKKNISGALFFFTLIIFNRSCR
ncbi:MAG: BamA/TamA family outer membrane protein [Ignavibacteria bacterium]|nr:BamA/TamA family outer membrane protein [Ignavibacteria bacterium]